LPIKSIDPIHKDCYWGFVIGKLGEISSQIWLKITVLAKINVLTSVMAYHEHHVLVQQILDTYTGCLQ